MHSVLIRRASWAVASAFIFAWALASQGQSLPSKPEDKRISVKISSERRYFQPGEDIRLRVEIRNESEKDLFVYKAINDVPSNGLAKIDLRLYRGKQALPMSFVVADCFCSERATYPPLAGELSKYWIALAPHHIYGGEVVLEASRFEKLKVPGRYRIQGKYSSSGFLAENINNPLLHYAEELKQLPYEAWVGDVDTNSVWIEITDKR